MAQKAPSPIDRHVASRIRLRRLQVGMSQEELALALNVTFQQVQKYEKGTNRISAGRLLEIASLLSVPIQFFYEDWPEPDLPVPQDAVRLTEAMSSPEIVSLITLVAGFKNANIRRSMRELAMAVAQELDERATEQEDT